MNVTSIASQFVDLALKYKRWDEIKMLPTDEVQVLLNTVSAAGFNPKKVMQGKIVGHYCDEDGSNTGETYPVNNLCSFKVVGQEDGDHYLATGWLDCALRCVVYGMTRHSKSREELIKVIAEEIERSVPLEPIQLTIEGDFLCEYPSRSLGGTTGFRYFVQHTRDEKNLVLCVGVHEFCNGWMDRRRATRTHDAIVCRGCHLRVLFQKEVKTYGDLRQALAYQRA